MRAWRSAARAALDAPSPSEEELAGLLQQLSNIPVRLRERGEIQRPGRLETRRRERAVEASRGLVAVVRSLASKRWLLSRRPALLSALEAARPSLEEVSGLCDEV